MRAAFIHSFPKANHDLRFLAPYFRRVGFDSVTVIGTTGGGCWWPSDFSYTEIGSNSYIAGDHLPRRLTDTVDYMLRTQAFDSLTACEYDVWFARSEKFPLTFPDGVMCCHKVGGRIEGCESETFGHWPFAANRAVWEKWLVAARQLLAEGRIELGSPDIFHSLACHVSGIQMKHDHWVGFSANTIHDKLTTDPLDVGFYPAAREAYRNGAVVFHGAKTSKQYRCTVERTVSAILA